MYEVEWVPVLVSSSLELVTTHTITHNHTLFLLSQLGSIQSFIVCCLRTHRIGYSFGCSCMWSYKNHCHWFVCDFQTLFSQSSNNLINLCCCQFLSMPDIMENRLELAKKLGADYVFKANDPNVLEDIRKQGPITQSFEWYLLVVQLTHIYDLFFDFFLFVSSSFI